VIELTDITKTYRMGTVDVQALCGITLRIERGEWVAIMGPSGCGKSSLMNIVGCLDMPTSGSYVLDGVQVFGRNEDQLAELRNRRFGFVFQFFNLLPRVPALQQVMLPLQYSRNHARVGMAERERRARAALETVGLAGRIEHRPSELSGGESQRVAIARALVNEPQVLLADEPTGNLDSHSGAELMGLMHQLHRERDLTIVMVTHDDAIGHEAQRIIRLYDGQVVDGGAA
jgi:putative ABC transport system ATP-binding protein